MFHFFLFLLVYFIDKTKSYTIRIDNRLFILYNNKIIVVILFNLKTFIVFVNKYKIDKDIILIK